MGLRFDDVGGGSIISGQYHLPSTRDSVNLPCAPPKENRQWLSSSHQ